MILARCTCAEMQTAIPDYTGPCSFCLAGGKEQAPPIQTYRPRTQGRHRHTHYVAAGADRALCGLPVDRLRPHEHQEGQRLCRPCVEAAS